MARAQLFKQLIKKTRAKAKPDICQRVKSTIGLLGKTGRDIKICLMFDGQLA